MNRLKELIELTKESKFRLAAAYTIVGQKSVAENLIKGLSLENENNDYYYYYGSNERYSAMLLETLVATNKKAEAYKLVQDISKYLSSNNWMSTQSTAYCLLAISKFAKLNSSQKLSVEYELNGKKFELNSSKSYLKTEFKTEKGSQNIKFKNKSGNMVYIKIVQSGKLPFGEDIAEQRNLSVQTQYIDQQGKNISPDLLKKGTLFKVIITVSNSSRVTVPNIALTNYLPSGWEMINTRFNENEQAQNYDYLDIRDDRQNYYFSLSPNSSKTFVVEMNASYTGKYYMPGIQAEAMYDNDYFTRNKGKWVVVEP